VLLLQLLRYLQHLLLRLTQLRVLLKELIYHFEVVDLVE